MSIALSGTGIWNASLRFGDEKGACEAAVTAEQLGYTAVWLPDVGGGDLFGRLAALLDATDDLVVATGILNLWLHDPSDVAARYTDLTAKYGERLLLGIGVSHAPVVEQNGAGQYAKPVAKMKSWLDELDATRAVPEGNRVLAALGPKMLDVAKNRAAGAHPYLGTVEHTAAAREALGPDKVLAPELGVVLDTDPARARESARANLTTYLQFPNYVNNWRRYGFTDADFVQPGSDALVDALVAWGDEEAIAAHVGRHRAAGADHVCIQVMTGEDAGQVAPYPVEQWRRLAALLV